MPGPSVDHNDPGHWASNKRRQKGDSEKKRRKVQDTEDFKSVDERAILVGAGPARDESSRARYLEELHQEGKISDEAYAKERAELLERDD